MNLCNVGSSIYNDGNCMINWTIVFFLCATLFIIISRVVYWAFQIKEEKTNANR